jgi:hypothetical protein
MKMRELISIVEREQSPAMAFQQAVEALHHAKQVGGEALTVAQQQANAAALQLPLFQQAKALHLINTIVFR